MPDYKFSPADKIHGEVMYHIFLRSFFDSNGDYIGDLNGINEKLDYLQELGVTTILVSPVVTSVYYHNYFADDFKKIAPEYGIMEDWINLVRAVHKRGMKIYLDQEFQYVTIDQEWFKDSYKNPDSMYSDYILYKDDKNEEQVPVIYDISELGGYDGTVKKVATVNLLNEKVQDYFYELLKYWMDPNGDGNFEDGVDGFRLDHMMDDLDDKGILTGLFHRFWKPLIRKLKTVNPEVIFLAEQADWNKLGTRYFLEAEVDRVFAFSLRDAIASFDKTEIASAAAYTFEAAPEGKQQIIFIENHDMSRFASVVDRNLDKLKVAAALNLWLGGIPSIYYGQELGMYGQGGFGQFGITDGNDIPRREAFEWYKGNEGNGMAVWYKDSGPWWDDSNLHPDDGVSLEEEITDPDSLWHFYKKIIHLRTSNSALSEGKYLEVKNDNESVFSFIRYTGRQIALVAVNLSGEAQSPEMEPDIEILKEPAEYKFNILFGDYIPVFSGRKAVSQMPPYGVQAWEIDFISSEQVF